MKRIAAVLGLVLAPVAALADDGAALFAKKCTTCHATDGKGTPGGRRMGAKDLTATIASEAEIAAIIANGKGKMAAYRGRLTDAEIDGLAKYIKAGLK